MAKSDAVKPWNARPIGELVAWMEGNAWDGLDETLQSWNARDVRHGTLRDWNLREGLPNANVLDTAFQQSDLSLERRRIVGEAWALTILASDRLASKKLLGTIEAGGFDYLRILGFISRAFGNVISAHSEDRLPRKKRDTLAAEIISRSQELSQLLRGTLFDASPHIFYTDEEVKAVAETVTTSLRLAHFHAEPVDKRLSRIMADALSGTLQDAEDPDEKLSVERIDMDTLKACLAASPKEPRMSQILEQLANSFVVAESDFGPNPGALRSLRKAFAKRLLQTPDFPGVTPRLISEVVEALFDELVEPGDVFG